jgi:hypothetical protein
MIFPDISHLIPLMEDMCRENGLGLDADGCVVGNAMEPTASTNSEN